MTVQYCTWGMYYDCSMSIILYLGACIVTVPCLSYCTWGHVLGLFDVYHTVLGGMYDCSMSIILYYDCSMSIIPNSHCQYARLPEIWLNLHE